MWYLLRKIVRGVPTCKHCTCKNTQEVVKRTISVWLFVQIIQTCGTLLIFEFQAFPTLTALAVHLQQTDLGTLPFRWRPFFFIPNLVKITFLYFVSHCHGQISLFWSYFGSLDYFLEQSRQIWVNCMTVVYDRYSVHVSPCTILERSVASELFA